MKNKDIFLQADWNKLICANYIIDPKILEKYIPFGTILDLHQEKCYVSLVCFKYSNTQLFGIKFPFYKNFEEINLRFYVKREISPGIWRKEAAFTQLFFPKRPLTFIANFIYKENYKTRPIKHTLKKNEFHDVTTYYIKNKKWFHISVSYDRKLHPIVKTSSEYFFHGHLWGTAKVNSKSSTSYKIEHPEWKTYSITNWEINVDFGSLFGNDFKFLNAIKPESVMMTEGSKVTVKKKHMIKG